MKNKVRQVLSFNQNWVAPAGVTNLDIKAISNAAPVGAQNMHTTNYAIDLFGRAYAWGNNTNGQMGDGTVIGKSSPTLVLGGLTFQSIVAQYGTIGGPLVFGITTTGQAYAWGSTANGASGTGSGVNPTTYSSPVAVLGGISFQSIVSGYNAVSNLNWTIGLSTSGKLYAWGDNTFGQLGVGDVVPRSSPVAVLSSLTFKSIYVGANYESYAISDSNDAYAWGSATSFGIGNGSNSGAFSSPIAVAGGIKFQSLLVAGVRFSIPGPFPTSVIGLSTTGQAYAWGSNAFGELGDGTVVAKSSPVAVLGGLTFQSIAGTSGAFGASTYASSFLGLTKAGKLYGWGYNGDGNLGVGDVAPRSSPVAVLGNQVFSSAGAQAYLTGFSTFAINSAGAMYAWGVNVSGTLGVGDILPRSSPVAVVGGIVFQSLFGLNPQMGNPNNFGGITPNGTIYMWGNNLNGQNGDGTVVSKSSPVAVLGNIAFQTEPQVSTTNIAVVPGTSYAVNFQGSMNASFGLNPIPGKFISSLVLEYFA